MVVFYGKNTYCGGIREADVENNEARTKRSSGKEEDPG